MLCALGVLILALGSVIEVLDLSVSVIASLLCVYAVIEIGGAYPWLIWIVTSIVSLLLLPAKTPVVFYVLLSGYYPILKEKLERLSKALCFALKLVIFHAMAGLFLLTMRIFFPEELLLSVSWMLIGSYVLAVVTFVVYDYALSKVITLYLVRLRDQFRLRLKK